MKAGASSLCGLWATARDRRCASALKAGERTSGTRIWIGRRPCRRSHSRCARTLVSRWSGRGCRVHLPVNVTRNLPRSATPPRPTTRATSRATSRLRHPHRSAAAHQCAWMARSMRQKCAPGDSTAESISCGKRRSGGAVTAGFAEKAGEGWYPAISMGCAMILRAPSDSTCLHLCFSFQDRARFCIIANPERTLLCYARRHFRNMANPAKVDRRERHFVRYSIRASLECVRWTVYALLCFDMAITSNIMLTIYLAPAAGRSSGRSGQGALPEGRIDAESPALEISRGGVS